MLQTTRLQASLTKTHQLLGHQTNAEIIQLVRESASQFNTPDYFLGYGIPNLGNALAAELSNQNNSRTEFKLFPNPVETNLQVLFPQDVENARIYIHDILGKLVLTATIHPFQPLNVQQLSSGLYLLKIQAESVNSKSLKLLKQ